MAHAPPADGRPRPLSPSSGSRARAVVGVGVLVAGLTAAFASACELFVGIPDVTLAPDNGCGRVAVNGAPRAGPDMVRIDAANGSYCIDTTEVTVGQFNQFLKDGGTLAETPSVCSGGEQLPLVDNAPEDQDVPMHDVSACHAWAYCQWAGKRLCGMIGDGGAVGSGTRPEDTEWIYACVNGVSNFAYPYGPTYDPQACNVDNASGGPVPVKSKAGCHGKDPPFDQIYDMGGNAWEFINDLEVNLGNVSAKGPAWATTPSEMTGAGGACLFITNFNGVVSSTGQSGFRCCATP